MSFWVATVRTNILLSVIPYVGEDRDRVGLLYLIISLKSDIKQGFFSLHYFIVFCIRGFRDNVFGSFT